MTTEQPTAEPSRGYSSFDREHEERLAAGQIVAAGRYRVVDELGHGGMAVVYEAQDLQRGEAVALKVVMGKLADKADAAARYHNEARLAAALAGHPHVVHPHEVGRLPELDDRLYLATELVRGRSLGAVVLEQPRGLEIGRACAIARDVARALVALHARGIVHRDLKPGNVMLEPHEGRERARLLDFGCAYATGDGDVAASPDLTMAHERVGSPVYMAPEQALGLRPTPAFDVYAFGATLYELLTGAPPYAGSSKAEVVQRKCAPDDPPRPVGRVRDGVPPRLAALVDACLARDAAARPESAQLLLHELELVMTALGLVEEPDAPSPSRPQPRHRWLMAAAGVLLLAGAAGATVLAVEGSHSTEQETGLVSIPAQGVVDDGAIASAPVDGSSEDGTRTHDGQTSTGTLGSSDAGPSSDAGTSSDTTRDSGTSGGGEPSETTSTNTPRPKPAAPRSSTPECAEIRAKAADERVARRWQDLLDVVTHDRKCWRDADERLLLRVAALNGLRRYEECARVGGSSRHRQIQRLVKQCEHELDETAP